MTVQETNIERVLQDHLWNEITLLATKAHELQGDVDALRTREQMLRAVAEAANIRDPQTLYSPTPPSGT